ncbi:HNH endonuclease [Pleurocapsales cyanobacterium LEGE 06147]|nr:HNH endonuclease [Pleurocapsales cyanobacterium LEGE 06147]
MFDKHQITEEPDEGNLSRPVLKTSRAGDSLAEFNRAAQDAIGAIFASIRAKAKYVLDADIAKCFDRINHNVLLKKLNTFPTLRRLVKRWLKAGVMDGKEMFPTHEGTPQGGVISPLLANIALHGLEHRLNQFMESLPGGKRANVASLTTVRYADDFVVLHPELDVINRIKQVVTEWLEEIGLEMSDKKTKVIHTLVEHNEQNPGFNFLGFNVRQYPKGKTKSAVSTKGTPVGFITLIKPSAEKIKLHNRELGKLVSMLKAAKQEELIAKLNPVIKGWSNYYSSVVSKEVFHDCDNNLFSQLRAWCKRRHPNKTSSWLTNKYWSVTDKSNWAFATKIGEKSYYLGKHDKTPITRHIKVKGNASPYNGDWAYWSTRRGNHPETPTRVAGLLKGQKGKCTHCGLYIKSDDLVEVDHIIPRSQGGKDEYKNWQLLHRHCHDEKTAEDNKSYVGSFYERGQNTEEPCEVKVSRTVLKTSGSRKGIT